MARERFARHSIGEDLIKGAIAGAAATWVMGKMSAVIRGVGRRADEVRGAGTGYGAAVEKAAGAIGRTLGGKDREPPGSAVHWALGIGSGAVYAVLRRRLAGISRTAGVGLGRCSGRRSTKASSLRSVSAAHLERFRGGRTPAGWQAT